MLEEEGTIVGCWDEVEEFIEELVENDYYDDYDVHTFSL